jgi:hypothetical protein
MQVAGQPISRLLLDSVNRATRLSAHSRNDLRLSPRAKLSLAYGGQLAERAQTHSVTGGFTLNF